MTIADFISIAAFRSTLTHRFRLTRLTRLTRLFPMQSSLVRLFSRYPGQKFPKTFSRGIQNCRV
jgi:hypothetical protein